MTTPLLPGHRTRKPSSRSGSSQLTSTSSTRAPDGPRRHQATIDSTRSRGPSKTAVTDPSRSLHTQPARPRDDARALVSERKNTPCTYPLTRTDALLVSVVPLLADERHEPH